MAKEHNENDPIHSPAESQVFGNTDPKTNASPGVFNHDDDLPGSEGRTMGPLSLPEKIYDKIQGY